MNNRILVPTLVPTVEGPMCLRCKGIIHLNSSAIGIKHHIESFTCDAWYNRNMMEARDYKKVEDAPTRGRWLLSYFGVTSEAAETRLVINRLTKELWAPDWVILLAKTYPQVGDPQYPNPRQTWIKLGKKLEQDHELRETLRGSNKIRGTKGLMFFVKIEIGSFTVGAEDSDE